MHNTPIPDPVTVTVLVENTTDGPLRCEHGLSLLIEWRGRRVLLDAGQSGLFLENADALGISLIGLDACVLSHGHYDHAGGFGALLRRDPAARVYAQKAAFEPHLSGSGGKIHPIGIPPEAAARRERFLLVMDTTEILPGVYLVPHSTADLARLGAKGKLYRQVGGELLPDDFAHEQSLVLDTERGLVLFNSCSHGGAANILREAREALGKPVYAYVGGLHLKGRRDGREVCALTPVETEALCAAFRRENVRHIYTGHCTGAPGLELLRQGLGERVRPLTTGLRFVV
ncbi:MAG: MBL fold metallo-hydrolase [Clostridiales bacterium]|nr:MBL fold metallo-hydrolase [Clostridiales bacterium]